MTLCIGKPEIRKAGEKTRLCSRISWDDGFYDMWFEVEDCFGEYLCVERADAFVLAVLPYAMKQALDVRVDSPLSEQLYYQLTTIYIPALARNAKTYYDIRLCCDSLDDEAYPSAGAVGTGFSGGVDSFYTVFKHLQTEAKRHSLTHLTFFNVGASGDEGGKQARKLFLDRQIAARSFADANGFEFLTVDSNISEFIRYEHLHTHTMRSLSAVLALQKLFSVYYYSSGRTLSEFNLKKGDEGPGHFDLMSAHCFTNENTKFYITGPNETRVEKCAAIADYTPSYRYLNVCIAEGSNCGRCEKCIRTMLGLYACGKLELYNEVFDVGGFMARLNKNLVMLVENRGNNYYKEILVAFKENGVRIPAHLRLLGNVSRIRLVFPAIRRWLTRIPILMRFYRKFRPSQKNYSLPPLNRR